MGRSECGKTTLRQALKGDTIQYHKTQYVKNHVQPRGLSDVCHYIISKIHTLVNGRKSQMLSCMLGLRLFVGGPV